MTTFGAHAFVWSAEWDEEGEKPRITGLRFTADAARHQS